MREGKAPEVVRRKGALGELPLPLDEKIEILVLLSQDPDETTRNTAFYTLQTWNVQELVQVLSDPATAYPVLDYAANHLMETRPELREALLRNVALPDDLREWIKQGRVRTVQPEEPALTAAPQPVSFEEEVSPEISPEQAHERETLLQRISRLTAAEKISLALKGNQDERLLLIRDSNKIVARSVLQSPKLTDAEVEAFASMKSVTEEVLRLISMNRAFMKKYSVVRNLVNNPRSPIDISLPLLPRLNERDMKHLTLNKNVAEVLRSMALKMVKQKAEANKPKLRTGKH